ncbi:TPA: hypothetical protein ACH3X1_007801 [Trebouxia sp. C0004]
MRKSNVWSRALLSAVLPLTVLTQSPGARATCRCVTPEEVVPLEACFLHFIESFCIMSCDVITSSSRPRRRPSCIIVIQAGMLVCVEPAGPNKLSGHAGNSTERLASCSNTTLPHQSPNT